MGDKIDKLIMRMSQNQTNGIPQGSVLMDFIAEMVLGYIDKELSSKLKQIKDFKILRYRDDYRIFFNNSLDGDNIVKYLLETLKEYGLKINSHKTHNSHNVIMGAVKSDKIFHIRQKTNNDLLKQLFLIYDFSEKFPNSGSLEKMLTAFSNKIRNRKKIQYPPLSLISIVTDIAYHNPRCYASTASIISKLLTFLTNEKAIIEVLKKIQKKFHKKSNSGFMELWIQRISMPHNIDLQYEELLCKYIAGKEKLKSIWNIEWLESDTLKKIIYNGTIIDETKKTELPKIIEAEEFSLFNY